MFITIAFSHQTNWIVLLQSFKWRAIPREDLFQVKRTGKGIGRRLCTGLENTMNVLNNKMMQLLYLFISFSVIQGSPCINEKDFKFKNHSCISIRKDESKRQSMCQHKKVRKACPQTCGLCCENDPDYVFKTPLGEPKEKDCKWIEEIDTRPTIHCDNYKNGRMVKDACPKACNFCKTKVLLHNKSPSSANNLPSLRPSVAPRVTESPTIACEDDHDFSFIQGRNGFSCSRIQKDETLRQDLCSKGVVRDACPLTCGQCCADDVTYFFLNKSREKKTCEWVGEHELRKVNYCKKHRNGRHILDACGKTCDSCKSKVPFLPAQSSSPSSYSSSVPSSEPKMESTSKSDPLDKTASEDESKDNNGTNKIGESSNSLTDQPEENTNLAIPKEVIIISSAAATLIIVGLFVRTQISRRRRMKNNSLDSDHYIDVLKDQIQMTRFPNEKQRNLYEQRMEAMKDLSDIQGSESDTEASYPREIDCIALTTTKSSSYVQPDSKNLNKIHSTVDVHQCLNFSCQNYNTHQSPTFIKAPRNNVERDKNGKINFVPVPVSTVGRGLKNQVPADDFTTCAHHDGMTITTTGHSRRSDLLNPLDNDKLDAVQGVFYNNIYCQSHQVLNKTLDGSTTLNPSNSYDSYTSYQYSLPRRPEVYPSNSY